MKIKSHSVPLVLLMLFICGVVFAAEVHNYKPPEGYIPTKEVAIKVALAVWEPIYGKEQIANEAPYNTKLENGVWHVSGSLPEGWVGGVAEIEIEKETGRIIRLSHGK